MYNPFSLQGKTILITGASSGIGRATAIECSKMGAAVIITGRNKMRLEETCSLMEGDGHSLQVSDLSDEREIDKLVETIPHIDGLVNNAGKTVQSLVQFVNHSSIDDIFKINTVAPILLTQKILKQKKYLRVVVLYLQEVSVGHRLLGEGIHYIVLPKELFTVL